MSVLFKRNNYNFIRINSISSIYMISKYNAGNILIPDIKDNPFGHKKKIMRGRGPNHRVGKGKRNANNGAGKPHRSYEGGQTPIHLMTPRFHWMRYDHNHPLQWLDIKYLCKFIENGMVRTDKVITMRELSVQHIMPVRIKNGLALINNDNIPKIPYKIHIEVTFVTPAAKEAIEAAGGIVRLKYYHKEKLRMLTKPWWKEILPVTRLDILPRPRWRHMFPDYPQLDVKEELRYLGKYQVHPDLLPKNVDDNEKMEQKNKLAINNFRPPRPLKMTHSNIRDKLFRWSKPT